MVVVVLFLIFSTFNFIWMEFHTLESNRDGKWAEEKSKNKHTFANKKIIDPILNPSKQISIHKLISFEFCSFIFSVSSSISEKIQRNYKNGMKRN